jgi:hypothetical protein
MGIHTPQAYESHKLRLTLHTEARCSSTSAAQTFYKYEGTDHLDKNYNSATLKTLHNFYATELQGRLCNSLGSLHHPLK